MTAAVAFPDISGETITNILIGGGLMGLVIVIAIAVNVLHARKKVDNGGLPENTVTFTQQMMYSWRMPLLAQLKPMVLS